MNCKYCGAPMTDEQVFCESCGKERELVPVFEAEIDDTLKDTISQIAVELAITREIPVAEIEKEIESETVEIEEEKQNIESQSIMMRLKKIRFPLFMISAMVLVILLVLVLTFSVMLKDQSSYEFHIKKAEQMCSEGDYEQMLEHAKKAKELAANSSDARMMIARAYEGMGNIRYEQEMLEDLIALDPAYMPAYELLIPLYEEQKEYQKIADLLSVCEQQQIKDLYVEYIAAVPGFSDEEGNYTEAIALKLLAPGSGKIYYTLDGTTPDETSKEYKTPIFMHSGHYVINVIYCNEYGIWSDVAEAHYYIDEPIVAPPEISPDSGRYTKPLYITVTIPKEDYQVYYTTDGSEPGIESMKYEKPIPLPLGTSTYAFAMIDEAGMTGEVAYRRYSLEMELACTGEQAKNMLIQSLITAGLLLNAEGDIPDFDGKRKYEPISVIEFNAEYYYLLEEYYLSPDGVKQSTGTSYAVNTTTGESYNAIANAYGTYELVKVQ